MRSVPRPARGGPGRYQAAAEVSRIVPEAYDLNLPIGPASATPLFTLRPPPAASRLRPIEIIEVRSHGQAARPSQLSAPVSTIRSHVQTIYRRLEVTG